MVIEKRQVLLSEILAYCSTLMRLVAAKPVAKRVDVASTDVQLPKISYPRFFRVEAPLEARHLALLFYLLYPHPVENVMLGEPA